MVLYNAATKELTAKIVYYGPGLGGKTTNLKLLHDRLDPNAVGKLITLATQTDRTIYFDMLPVEHGEIKGYKIRHQLTTVPGPTPQNETRKAVLRGADGIVFVVDSRRTMLAKNRESWQSLKDNVKGNGGAIEKIPIVVQFNKRDLTDILSVEAMQEALGLSSYPFVEAVASAGRGISETFKLVSKLTFVDLLRRLQGRRPEEAAAAQARTAPAPVATPAEAPPSAGASSGAPAAERLAGLESRLSEVSERLEHEKQENARLAQDAAAAVEQLTALESRLAARDETARAAEERAAAATAERLASLETRLAAAEGARRPAEETAAMEGRLAGLETRLAAAEEARAVAETAATPGMEGRLASLETRLAAAEETRAAAEKAAEPGTESRLASLETRLAAEEEARRAAEKTAAPEMESRLATLESRLTAEEEARRAAEKAPAPEMESRLATLESRLTAEEEARRAAEATAAAGAQSGLAILKTWLAAEEESRAATEKETDAVLAGFLTRAENLSQDIAGALRKLSTLEASLDEKTAQGLREAEDIRAQIAPLLEARAERGAVQERSLAELDHLRESFADSLAEIAERLRRAVRET